MYKCVFSIFLKLPFCSYVNAWDNVSGSLKPAFECFRPDNGFFPALFYLMFFNIRLYHASFLSTTPLSGLSFPLLPHPLSPSQYGTTFVGRRQISRCRHLGLSRGEDVLSSTSSQVPRARWWSVHALGTRRHGDRRRGPLRRRQSARLRLSIQQGTMKLSRLLALVWR